MNQEVDMIVEIPESHRGLLDGPRVAALTTLMPDGQPQSSLYETSQYDCCINQGK